MDVTQAFLQDVKILVEFLYYNEFTVPDASLSVQKYLWLSHSKDLLKKIKIALKWFNNCHFRAIHLYRKDTVCYSFKHWFLRIRGHEYRNDFYHYFLLDIMQYQHVKKQIETQGDTVHPK